MKWKTSIYLLFSYVYNLSFTHLCMSICWNRFFEYLKKRQSFCEFTPPYKCTKCFSGGQDGVIIMMISSGAIWLVRTTEWIDMSVIWIVLIHKYCAIMFRILNSLLFPFKMNGIKLFKANTRTYFIIVF